MSEGAANADSGPKSTSATDLFNWQARTPYTRCLFDSRERTKKCSHLLVPFQRHARHSVKKRNINSIYKKQRQQQTQNFRLCRYSVNARRRNDHLDCVCGAHETCGRPGTLSNVTQTTRDVGYKYTMVHAYNFVQFSKHCRWRQVARLGAAGVSGG